MSVEASTTHDLCPRKEAHNLCCLHPEDWRHRTWIRSCYFKIREEISPVFTSSVLCFGAKDWQHTKYSGLPLHTPTGAAQLEKQKNPAMPTNIFVDKPLKKKKSTTRISNSRQLATWTSLDGNKDFLTWITGLWRGGFPFQEGRNLNASAGEKHKKQSLHRGQGDSWAANPF